MSVLGRECSKNKKVFLMVTDPDKGVVKIPLKKIHIHELYDFLYAVDLIDDTIKLNKWEDAIKEMHESLAVVIDALDNGSTYSIQGKVIKLAATKDFWHSGKEPKWVKE